MTVANIKINFDDWAALAKSDPETFEVRRKEVIRQLIQSAPVDQQHRLECLQWKIDQVRSMSKTPLAACLRISKMMWDRVLGAGGLMESLDELGVRSKAFPGKPVTEKDKVGSATVLALDSMRIGLKKGRVAR